MRSLKRPDELRGSYALRTSYAARKPMFFELVGARIVAERKRAGLSRNELAEACLVSATTLGLAEAGGSCSLPLIALIADALDVTIDTMVPTEASDVLLGKLPRSEAAE